MTFLGGVGEIGRNMTLIESEGRLLIVDVGLMFPTEDMLGVDLVLPDFENIRDREDDIEAILLTHGHEDHVGGVPFLMREMNPPIYGSPLTLGLLRNKLVEHRFAETADLHPMHHGRRLKLGPFDIDPIEVSHSIPGALALVIHTPDGSILHTGDFKSESETDAAGGNPVAALSGTIDVMLADSTNADHPGKTPSEDVAAAGIAEVIESAEGRVVIACFASNIHRVAQIVEASSKAGRLVALLGRSMINNVEVARGLGYVNADDSMFLTIEESKSHPPEQTVVLCTGSQGEPLSALSLMATRDHKHIKLNETDTVVLSATPIPGNESAVRRVIDGLFRIGARVIQPPASPVHVSGHASADDLKLLTSSVNPKWFVPIHGEYRHLAIHAGLAHEAGVPKDHIMVVEDGDVLELSGGTLSRGERVEAGYVFVDGIGIGDVQDAVLRDRRLLADDGVVVCVVTIDSQTGELLAGPDIISRGFVYEDQASGFIEIARAEIRESLADLAEDEITDWGAIRQHVRKSLGKAVWRHTRRRPIIVPVVMEV
ncbi:MAG: ribonuclease J [Actinomycetota bacterium]|nr:ribonuclease J [Actinomycetota bacterium]